MRPYGLVLVARDHFQLLVKDPNRPVLEPHNDQLRVLRRRHTPRFKVVVQLQVAPVQVNVSFLKFFNETEEIYRKKPGAI